MSHDAGSSPAHGRRIITTWLALSVIGVLAVIFGLGPHMPPGNVSDQAAEQTQTNTVLAVVMTPIFIGVITFFVYAIATFRAKEGDTGDGPYVKGDRQLSQMWVGGSIVIVLALAIYGTFELLAADKGIAGVGGGQGSSPIVTAPANALQVQVIGQQWAFTYRYPQYGDIETVRLVIPVDRPVIFHVTSLDVMHSFWAYQIGVKADAVPGADNVAGVTVDHTGTFDIRCAELCGVWHGNMASKGSVLSQAGFAAWIARQSTPVPLPGRRPVYYPDPNGRAG